MEISESNTIFEIEAPPSLLFDLDSIGIPSVDDGVCEDTFENRRTLRQRGLRWRPVYNTDGTYSNNILVVSPEMDEAYMLQRKGDILVDGRTINSDYLTGIDLLLVPGVEAIVPAWVLAATRKWNRIEKRREELDKKVQPHLIAPPGRCTAWKMNGDRCKNWHNGAKSDGLLCRMHVGRPGTDTAIVEHARMRMKSAGIAAVDELEALLDKATSEPVRLKAATEILDRIGIRAGVEIDQNVTVEVRPAADMINDRLRRLAISADGMLDSNEEAEEIEDAVIVEDGAEDD